MSEPILCHTCDNGLVLVAEPMPWVQSAAFSLLLPAGCAYDPAERSGLAGFTCEMVQRGAGTRDSHRFVLDLDNLGIERSESVNYAHTTFSGATVAENLLPGLEILSDLMRRPHLPEAQLPAARLVMLQELRAVEDEPVQKVMLRLRQRFYPDPWGRSPHGEQQAIEATTIEDVRGHFHRCYRPNGTIVGAAGRFDWPALLAAGERLLGDWQPVETRPCEERNPSSHYTHLPYDSNQTHIGIAYPSIPYRHPDYFQAWGAAGVLGRGSSARLFTEVRERRGLCYAISAEHHTVRDYGGVFCYAGTSAERAQATLDVMLAELNRLAAGIEEDELHRLKSRIKAALMMQQESSSARSAAVARDWYHLGRVRTLDELEGLVNGLTCKSINAYLREHPPSDFTIVTLGPRELEVPVGVSRAHTG